jgi:hypothetical protein
MMWEPISRQAGAMGLLRFGTHQIAQLLQHLREEVAILSFHVTLQIILLRAVGVSESIHPDSSLFFFSLNSILLLIFDFPTLVRTFSFKKKKKKQQNLPSLEYQIAADGSSTSWTC